MLSSIQHARQLQRFIVRPALAVLGDKYGGLDAERLVVGTALTESHGQSFDQITGKNDNTLGPAFGLWQIEPWVVEDLQRSFIAFAKDRNLGKNLELLKAKAPSEAIQLATNLCYGAAVCRLLYYRHPEAMPTTLAEMDIFWKKRYNTIAGKGETGDFVKKAAVVMNLEKN